MYRIKLLLVALFIGQSLLAQEVSVPKPVQISFRAGLNGSLTTNGFGPVSTTKDPSMKLGLLAGVAVNIPLSPVICLQPELSYSREGSLQEGLIGSPSDNNYVLVFTTRLHFLNLPVLLQYNKGKGIYFETGPQAGFLLGANLKNEFPPAGQPKVSDIQNTNLANASWVIGTGYTFPSGLSAGLRYTIGLTNYVTGVSEQKVNTLQVHVMYWFRKKTK